MIVGEVTQGKGKPERYGRMVGDNSREFMTGAQRNELFDKFRASIKKGGLIAISQFTVEEPVWKRLQSNKDHAIGLCTLKFRDQVMNFAQLGEYKQLFIEDHIIHHWEGRVETEGHPGAEQPHFHEIVSVIARIVAKTQTDR